ncbi:branched-chain amino acid ABC transporter permease [Paracraurococcus ruber]|uniref:Amino acid ABC transporter permease n=1 Tax=Paracraurococcus ruber TaxID=77675 RepID=A0ABS1D5M2_9PROT|nr:branched-chain amino acid ABC transporter permease [Paracraurococcus ruber]MBK1662109.1 amino acid ABC transporter permease [Paracraurococcus ruber]TDG23458.1 branched-chain amino acid ABC transporter permease [Paracraurococcus ruber]
MEDWRDLLQVLVNGVMAGSVLMLPAIGLNGIFAVLRYPNFAVAGFATIGAFAGWVANVAWGMPAPAALAFAFLVAGVAGLLAEEAALRPLRPAGPLTVAIGSVALTLLLENIIRFAFGNDLRGYDLPVQRDWRFDGIRVNPQQLANAGTALAAAGALFALLAFTRLGRAMRAVADNPVLADIKGVDPDRIARLAVFLGAGLAGLGGMLVGLDTSIDPLTGFRVILSVFAAAVVGGLGSIPGAALGALVVGVGEELAGVILSPAYRSVTAFLAILLVLLLRPQGLFGARA